MTNILYGLLISVSGFFSQITFSSEQTSASLVKKENLSTVASKYSNFLETIDASEDMQNSVSEISTAADSYYKNLTRYFGFRIMANILESRIENNYKKYQEELTKYMSQNTDSPLTQQLRAHNTKLHQEMVSWVYLKKCYAYYPGHIL
jgi:hypothetical protein